MPRSLSRYGARPLDSRPRLRKTLWWLAGSVVFIAVFGFLIAPLIVRSQAEKRLSVLLDRPVTIERVAINPFALSTEVAGFRVGERSGDGAALAFETFYGRLSYETFIRFAPVVAEAKLEKPFLHLVRTPEKTYNFQDLVEKFGKRSAAAPPKPDKSARFSFNNLQLVDGKVELDDQAEKQKHQVTDINISVPSVSNFEAYVDAFVQPRLEAVVNGDPLRVTGETKPFKDSLETRLALNLSDVDLSRYLEYSPVALPFTLPTGKLDAALSATFVQSSKEKSTLTLGGNAALRDFAVEDASGARVVEFSQLGIVINSLDVFGRKADIARIGLESPVLDVRREKDGSLNLAKLIPRAPAQREPGADEKPTVPFAFEIGEIAVTNGRMALADLVPEKAFRRRIEKLEVRVQGLRSAENSQAGVEVSFDSQATESDGGSAAAARVDYSGVAQLSPLKVGGTLQVLQLKLADLYPYYSAAINAEPLSGAADISAVFDISLPAGTPTGRVSEINATLSGVRLRLPGSPTPLADIPSAAVENGEADLAARRITLDEVAVDGPAYTVVRDADGILNATRILKTAPAEAPQPDAAQPWVVTVNRFELGRGRATFEDRSVKPRVKVALRNMTLEGDGLSTAADAQGQIAFRTVVNRAGTVSVRGKLSAMPAGSLAIAVRKVDLVPFKPYLAPYTKAEVTGGNVSTRGTLTLRAGERTGAAYKGDFEIAALALRDGKNGGDLLKWQSLRFAGIDATSEPLRASVGEIALADFFARLVLDASGQLNLREVAQDAEPGAKSTKAAMAAAAEKKPSKTKTSDAAPSTGARRPVDWLRIGAVRLQNGSVDFSDFFVRPNYRANLTELKGSISTLTFEQPGELELSGMLNQVAALDIRGRINPLSANLALDIQASARDIELPRLSPYSAKYLGYGIDRGKLSVKVKYLLQDRKLTAENNLYLDQLKLGEKVQSPDAADLPVPLAVSLLQDRNGVIDVSLPIGGSLDDPQFSISGIVMQVIGNIITKAVTAPFALLGSVAGAEGNLDYLEFEPGSARLTTASQKKLDALARALADRPGLKLDVTGRADPSSDREGLKRSAVERAVKQEKFDDLRDEGKAPKSLDEVTVDASEYPALLERAYSDADIPGKPRNFLGFAKDIPPAEMEKLMLASASASEADLRNLALARAQAAKQYLIDEGKIPAARVFIVAPKVGAEDAKASVKPTRVEFALR